MKSSASELGLMVYLEISKKFWSGSTPYAPVDYKIECACS